MWAHTWCRNAAAIILKIAYGYTVDESDDEFVRIAQEGVKIASALKDRGRYFVEYLPWRAFSLLPSPSLRSHTHRLTTLAVRYLPEWLPGAGFKRKAKEWKKLSTRFRDVPFEEGKRRMVSVFITSQLLML